MSCKDIKHVRNFAVIAHIDHGKSTLADRIIQICGGLPEREMGEQVLDSMELERERGITIKAQSVALNYKSRDGHGYRLNMIDTPGHVDFSYEVSRSLTACEGALLVVDATQGVQAQTVANCIAAVDLGLELIPVLNKIDLPAAEPERVVEEIENILGISCEHAVRCSAKTGEAVGDVLEAIVSHLPAPTGNSESPLKALILDSWFDNYLGTVSLVRIFDGRLSVKDRIRMMATGRDYTVEQIGIFSPKRTSTSELAAGDVGYLIAGVKQVKGARVGDTICSSSRLLDQPMSGFRMIKPRVFAGLYPANSSDYGALRDALDRLSLNDASLRYDPETSGALGFGFHCGFLGTLHMEIIQERLEREYNLDLISTAPTVEYEVATTDGKVLSIENPSQFPDTGKIVEIREPIIEARILAPLAYVGPVMTLCIERRGVQRDIQYLGRQVMLVFELPLNEVIFDFFNKLKSLSRGYATFDYELREYRGADICKVDILINGERVDPLSVLAHRRRSESRARELVTRIRTLIPRQMFDVAIQAAIGSKVVARETVKALRKNVTAKCYGGDVSRKRKLLEKQREGKKRMKRFGSVDIPQEAFLAVLQVDGD